MKQLARCLTKHLLAAVFLFFLVHKVRSQQENPLTLEASYVFDALNSPNAALATGNAYMGMIDLIAGFNTADAGWWQGGEMAMQVGTTHGATSSADMVGDLQVFSNIDNGNYTYLLELWYKQSFNKFSLTFGVHDMNSEFLVSEYAIDYINSSFGFMPTVSMNVGVSSFPKTCMAVVMAYDVDDNTSLRAGVYQGDPLDLDVEPYNTQFDLSKAGGYLTIAEVSRNMSLLNGLEGSYRAGGYYHSGVFDDLSGGEASIKGNYGAYAIAEQFLYSSHAGRQLASFFHIGYAPEDRNAVPFFLAAGLNIHAPFAKRQDDMLGLALASMTINKNLLGETGIFNLENEQIIECFYKAQISEKVALQPELQYIINPGAVSGNNNTLLGLIRTSIIF
ncbi:carbohydrate porin [Carboxylicivirga sp. RSCT41]|uniref:carbohydrate porin n=1 Tax=Carboxylicivirga agarovorans TaxID=3417570 RepID=UPI003D32F58F